jgi:glycosyltransferase involved in cell wall biosynthesis
VAGPLVSVLMPVYNAEATLAEALDSLQAQTLGDLEIVAVDDGSTDSTAEMLRRRQVEDPRVRPVLAPHEGLVAALNRGLTACRGASTPGD